jgi:hypothetical protein
MKLRKFALLTLTAVLGMAGTIAEARMYQWVSPQSGYTQFSGKPPAWYRSAGGGPRVQVFENGKLIDDTIRPVSRSVRESLRARAFQETEETKLSAIAKKEKPSALSEAEEGELVIPEHIEDQFATTKKAGPQEKSLKALQDKAKDPDAAAVEQLKSLIADWDKRRTKEAKNLLESKDKPMPPDSP